MSVKVLHTPYQDCTADTQWAQSGYYYFYSSLLSVVEHNVKLVTDVKFKLMVKLCLLVRHYTVQPDLTLTSSLQPLVFWLFSSYKHSCADLTPTYSRHTSWSSMIIKKSKTGVPSRDVTTWVLCYDKCHSVGSRLHANEAALPVQRLLGLCVEGTEAVKCNESEESAVSVVSKQEPATAFTFVLTFTS